MRTTRRLTIGWVLAAILICSTLTLTGADAASGSITPATKPPQVISTIPVGYLPTGVDVNVITNRVYVANANSNTVTVIDGSTNKVITTISAGSSPFYVAVNPQTNRI